MSTSGRDGAGASDQEAFGTRRLACGTMDGLIEPGNPHWQWRLSQLQAGDDAEIARHLPCQLSPLDAALALRTPDGRPLLRLQVIELESADILAAPRAREDTRLACLQLRGEITARLIARPLQGPMLLPQPPGTRWLAWLLAGRAEVSIGAERWPLDLNQPAWLSGADGASARLHGGGELVLVRLAAPEQGGR